MENKINIAELLKNCPSGMELDCLMYEDVYFDYVDELNIIHCYIKHETHKASITFNQHGTPNSDIKSKCVIYPKSTNTWEGFQKPFKDGDILISDKSPFIYKNCDTTGLVSSYCAMDVKGNFWKASDRWTRLDKVTFATEEDKQKLFKTIKDNGYRWNKETKTLEKLPKFKVGDKIKLKGGDEFGFITEVTDCFYTIKNKNRTHCWPIKNQDNWELVSNKFDISNLKPFYKVLVRDFDNETWEINFFSRLLDGKHFKCLDLSYIQCIPYEGNEHLLNTSNEPDDIFKTWQKN